MRDFEGGYERGQKFVERFPENMELRAWFHSEYGAQRDERSKPSKPPKN
jgi:hypothetical protein